MIDLDKLEQVAQAAIAIQHSSSGYWYDADDFFNGLDADEDAEFASACRPKTILKLISVARAAQNFSDVCDSFKATTPIPPSIAALREALEALE